MGAAQDEATWLAKQRIAIVAEARIASLGLLGWTVNLSCRLRKSEQEKRRRRISTMGGNQYLANEQSGEQVLGTLPLLSSVVLYHIPVAYPDYLVTSHRAEWPVEGLDPRDLRGF
jgi:hypothetical protein